MKPAHTTARTLPYYMLVVLLIVSFSLSCRLEGTALRHTDTGGERSAAGRFLGSSRIAIGARFYSNADKYFHKGIAHAKPRAFEDTPFQRMLAEVSPEGHFHLEDRNLNEIMPWLWLSIRMNPGNPEAYLVAAFWLSHDRDHYDVAMQLLREAQSQVPFNYEIQLEKGRLLLRQNRLAAAAAAFDAGIAFWPGKLDPTDADARVDMGSLLLHRALLYEAAGNNAAAIASIKMILAFFPERTSLQHHIEELKSGGGSPFLASRYWQQLIKDHDQALAAQICDKDEQHQHDEHCEHH